MFGRQVIQYWQKGKRGASKELMHYSGSRTATRMGIEMGTKCDECWWNEIRSRPIHRLTHTGVVWTWHPLRYAAHPFFGQCALPSLPFQLTTHLLQPPLPSSVFSASCPFKHSTAKISTLPPCLSEWLADRKEERGGCKTWVTSCIGEVGREACVSEQGTSMQGRQEVAVPAQHLCEHGDALGQTSGLRFMPISEFTCFKKSARL